MSVTPLAICMMVVFCTCDSQVGTGYTSTSTAQEILETLGFTVELPPDNGSWASTPRIQALDGQKLCEVKYVGAARARKALARVRKSEERDLDGKPLLLKGLAEKWPALLEWPQRSAFLAKHGALMVGVGAAGAIQSFHSVPGVKRNMTLKEFAAAPLDRGHVAFFHAKKEGGFEALLHSVQTPPELSDFDSNQMYVISLGHDGTGLSPHVHGDTWLTLIVGAKLWYFQPPAWVQWLPRHSDFLSYIREHERAPHTQICVQLPGETVFVPSGWGHATVNIGFTIAVGQQEAPPMVRKANFKENPLNPHMLLRLVSAVKHTSDKASRATKMKHLDTILAMDPYNPEALYEKLLVVAQDPDMSAKARQKICKKVAKTLETWLKDHDPLDELVSAALKSARALCQWLETGKLPREWEL